VSIEQLMQAAANLSYDEKGQLADYLVQLRNREDPHYLPEITRRITDKTPGHWLTPDQFEKRITGDGD
jgi:hypothetical protein